MPRLPYADDEVLPSHYDVLDEHEDDMADGVDEDWWNAQPTVRTFANNPALAETHVHANVSMWKESGLSPREVEYVILAVGREMDSAYEWHDHVIKAIERIGMSRDEVLAIAAKDTSAMDDATAALVNYAFEFVAAYGEVSDECYDDLTEQYDRSTVVGATMLAGYYVFLHHVATALGLELEEEFVGWELENY